ncbi:hypothetical protein MRB53_027180 [Persea americana]|uniref:Uncharacterized protein n=1 Tax=Persea americana TaxID=3435 RepID=A0ACC2LK99_PERAE|nr:hypothetical protein MRB53_027180 [Persea americana]
MSTGHGHHEGPASYAPSAENRLAFPLILTVVVLAFFFLGFFSLYFCRYMTTATWLNPQQAPNAAAQALNSASDHRGGLHPSIVASFPTFPYALVKDHRRGKCGLECAICLSEFAGDDVLRLLTACSHAFHLGCIDLWFESHTTCPVCRRELDPAETSPEKATEVRIPMPESDGREERAEAAEAEEVTAETQQRISFKEEEEEERRRRRGGDVASETREHVAAMDWLPRSHSTGHSLADDDRFALRLPENVKERIMRERNWTGSCILFEDYKEDDLVVMNGSDLSTTTRSQVP